MKTLLNTKEELKRQKRIHGLSEEISNEELRLLEEGVPIQYIIGFIDFDNLKIKVDKRALIPRYETQEVVNKALEFIKDNSSVLDLCTGSGYIGLSIASKTNAKVTISDICPKALELAKENAEMNDLSVKILHSDLFKNINDKFDIIVSNPPYIPKGNIVDKSVLDHEPLKALFAGEDGNKFYKKIIASAPKYLNDGGWLIFEISEDNKDYIISKGFKVFNDINNKARIAIKQY